MPSRLKRYYGAKHLHYITGSCYHRLPRLGTAARRDLFLRILEQTRRRYRFVVVGYVVMPEHFHLLISEPEVGDPLVVMKVVKERFAQQVHGRRSPKSQLGLWPEAEPERICGAVFYGKPHSFAKSANEWATRPNGGNPGADVKRALFATHHT